MHVARQRRMAEIYRQQPRRTTCKNCDAVLDEQPDFIKDEIEYVLCCNCSHLNGWYEDTDAFCRALYTADSGEEYGKTYQSQDVDAYNYRTASIYLPKAEFLASALTEDGVDPHHQQYLDFGAGSGYFVSALKKLGLRNISGSEVSASQVAFGNAMIGESLLSTHALDQTSALLRATSASVVSMIGVLEHLQHPRTAMAQLQANDNVRFVYISVPTFSLSVYLEMLSPELFHRHLHGAHTHLYTDESLAHLSREFGFTRVGQWWFGADVVDLHRHISVTLEKNGCSAKLMQSWRKDMVSVLDAMQLELDKKHWASEVHLLLRKTE